jgi:hypothetical protein
MSKYVSNITIEYYFTRYNLHTFMLALFLQLAMVASSTLALRRAQCMPF